MSVETLNLRVSRIQKSQEIRRSLAHPPACGACSHGDICETCNIFQLCPRPAHCQLASQIDQLKRITPKITVSVFHYICFWWYTTFRAGKKNKMLTSTLGSKGGIFIFSYATCQLPIINCSSFWFWKPSIPKTTSQLYLGGPSSLLISLCANQISQLFSGAADAAAYVYIVYSIHVYTRVYTCIHVYTRVYYTLYTHKQQHQQPLKTAGKFD